MNTVHSKHFSHTKHCSGDPEEAGGRAGPAAGGAGSDHVLPGPAGAGHEEDGRQSAADGGGAERRCAAGPGQGGCLPSQEAHAGLVAGCPEQRSQAAGQQGVLAAVVGWDGNVLSSEEPIVRYSTV